MKSLTKTPALTTLLATASIVLLSSCGSSYEPLAVDKLPKEQVQSEPLLALNEDKPGAAVNVQNYLAGGKYTLVEYYSPYSPECSELQQGINQLPQMYNFLAVRTVNINRPGVQGVDFQSPAAQELGLTTVPYFYIYEANKSLRAHGRPAREQVMQWLRETQTTVAQ